MKNIVKNFNQFLTESADHTAYSICCGAPIEVDGTCSRCGEHCEEPEEERSAETGRYHDDEPTAHDRMYNSDDWVRAQRDAEGLDEAKKKSRKEVLADADEKYPNLKPESMKKGLSHMKGKDFKEKAKKNFGWADKPEAAAAAYMRKATGKEPRDI